MEPREGKRWRTSKKKKKRKQIKSKIPRAQNQRAAKDIDGELIGQWRTGRCTWNREMLGDWQRKKLNKTKNTVKTQNQGGAKNIYRRRN